MSQTKSVCHYLTNLKLTRDIKILIYNIKILIRNIKYFFLPFTIIIKKEKAINLRWKYFYSFDLLYYNKLKVTSKKIVPDSHDPLYYNKLKGASKEIVLDLYDIFYYNNQKSN